MNTTALPRKWKRAPRRTAAAVLGLALLIGLVGALLRDDGEVQTAAPDRCRPAANVEAKQPSGKSVVVPTVQGLSVDDAFARLAKVELRPSTKRAARIAYNISPPIVAAQEPAPGARLPRGSTVRLTLEEGATGLLPGGEDEIVVPQLVGLNLEAAIQVLYARHRPQAPLSWMVDLPPLPPTDAQTFTEAYCVTGQEPSAGATAVQEKDGWVLIGVRLSAAPADG